MKYCLTLCLTLCMASLAWAQDGRYDSIVLGPRGPVAGASIAVCTQPAVTTIAPCTPLATLFTDSTGATVAPNPLNADALGNFHFYAAPGLYTVQLYGAGISPPTVLKDQLVLQSTSGSVTNVSASNLAPLFTTVVTNPTSTPNIAFTLSTAAPDTVFGNCTTGTAIPTFCSVTAGMIPFPTGTSIGGIESVTCPTGAPLQFITSISGLGVPTCAPPSSSGFTQFETFTFCAAGCTVTGTPCSTTTGANNECTSPITMPVAFANTGYAPACSGAGAITGFPFIPFVAKTSASVLTVTISNGQGSAAMISTFGEIDCVVAHP